MKYLLIVFSTLFLVGSAATGQSPTAPVRNRSALVPAPSSSAPELQKRNPRYRLSKGDSFDLEFEFTPEFNQTAVVQPDGFVILKGIGSMLVEGRSVPELTDMLKAAYSKTLHDPVITIVLKDFEKPYFIASGQVSKPGKYDLRSPLTLTEAVALAGGFNDSAKHSQVVLFHPTENGMFESKIVNVKKLLESRNLNEDIYLQPGDMLYVPQNTISKLRKYIPSTALGAYYNPAAF